VSSSGQSALKILHVIPSISLKHGGPSVAIKSLVEASRRAGMEVAVVSTDDDGSDARFDVPLGTPIERDGVPHFFFRRDFVSYKISFGLARWLNGNIHLFDVVHIHALFSFASTAASCIARRKKIPYVVRPLGVLNQWGLEHRRRFLKQLSLRFIELPILRHAAAIHFTTRAERSEAARAAGDTATRRSFVIPIPVKVKESENGKNDFVQKFPAAAGKKLILFLSRLDQKKGLELLFNAFVGVRRAEPESLLVISGDGDSRYVESLHVQAERLGISANILWTGFLGPTNKANAFAAAAVFVLPSYSENFGIAAAEALAAGVPAIVSDQVALAQDVGNARAALIVQADEISLRTAMLRILADSELREQLSANARSAAARMFSHDAVGKSLEEQYRLILEKAKQGA
jgi:glycosyltransferase involved in cell wall biosynthesis